MKRRFSKTILLLIGILCIISANALAVGSDPKVITETDINLLYDTVNAAASSKIPLTAPIVTVSNKASTGKIVLTWDKVSGAEKYEIWRALKGGTYSKIFTTTGTSLTNTSPVAGKIYYYKVRAIAGDRKGPFSAAVSRTCDLAQPVITVKLNS
ncbi:MAG: hypothetical protein IJ955_03770, partial [Oscillospiraceae bacterium]|nr:hypothetical protein [Oscillospiraceae bacterium]